MSRPLPLVMAQVEPQDIGAPIGDFARAVQEVVADYPQTTLVIYPELHLYGVSGLPQERDRQKLEAAEPLAGPKVKALAEIAGDLGVWLLPGTVCERADDGGFYNTAVVFSPQGRLVAWYRKIFPWRPFEPYTPGDRFVVFELDGVGRVGLSICYDSWFPEVTRHLAWMGAEVVLCPTQTTSSDRAQELVLTRANAIANQVYVVSVNAAAPYGFGRSLVADPEGRVRTEAGTSPEIMTEVIDLDDVSRVRAYGTAGLNRVWSQFRPDDATLALPLYEGRIDPARWSPRGPS